MNDQTRKRISKFLSLVLRHQPEKIGISLDSAGWTDVEVLLAALAKAGRRLTRAQLDEVIATNDKKRFELSEDGKRVRASQGHSVRVDLGYQPAEPPDVLYHGAADRNRGPIFAMGLIKGARHHVHLSADYQTAVSVGQRHGRPCVLIVDARQMVSHGHRFFLSTNGVWLTDHIPPQYLREADPDRA